MGINAFAFNMISVVAKEMSHQPVKMLSLGYPDILLPKQDLDAILGEEGAEQVKVRPDSAGILDWHHKERLVEKVPDAHDFFNRVGIELSVTDFQEVRGDEIICDLNQPLADELYNQFDIVFDGGTLEHCFNVDQAIMNILGMAKVDGYVIHSNPLILINHGFYNFSPTFYHDFYTQNGHEFASNIIGSQSIGSKTKAWVLEPVNRLSDVPVESAISVVIKKRHSDAPIFPTQSKYLNSPKLTMDK